MPYTRCSAPHQIKQGMKCVKPVSIIWASVACFQLGLWLCCLVSILAHWVWFATSLLLQYLVSAVCCCHFLHPRDCGLVQDWFQWVTTKLFNLNLYVTRLQIHFYRHNCTVNAQDSFYYLISYFPPEFNFRFSAYLPLFGIVYPW